MSFLDNYVKKHRLDKMPEKHKENIKKLEEKLDKYVDQASGSLTFEDCIKQYGPQIADLVERVSNYVKDFPGWSLSSAMKMFRFINNISVEVYQIVEAMAGCVIGSNMTDEEQRAAKIGFGKELVYFVWKTVDPFKGRFNWLPLKATIEKKIVMWLAGMALESTIDMFKAGAFSSAQVMSADKSIQILKAL